MLQVVTTYIILTFIQFVFSVLMSFKLKMDLKLQDYLILLVFCLAYFPIIIASIVIALGNIIKDTVRREA